MIETNLDGKIGKLDEVYRVHIGQPYSSGAVKGNDDPYNPETNPIRGDIIIK